MAFGIYSQDTLTFYPLPTPLKATWDEPVESYSLDGQPTYDYFVKVRWEFGPNLSQAFTNDQYNILVANRISTGEMYFRTENGANPPIEVMCKGMTNKKPGGTRFMGLWIGVVIEFWQVEVIG
jgi:hypothetical protein